MFERFANYMRGTKEELKKITWSSKEDTIRYSVLVAVITLITAASFAGLDFLFSYGLKLIIE